MSQKKTFLLFYYFIHTDKSSKSQGVDDQCSSFKLPRISKTWSGTSSVSETSGMCLLFFLPHFKTKKLRKKKKNVIKTVSKLRTSKNLTEKGMLK